MAASRDTHALVDISSTLSRLAQIDATSPTPLTEASLAETAIAPTERAPPTGGRARAEGQEPGTTPGTASRYLPIGLLGEGGMGRVEHMRDTDLLREVAVKHLLPSLVRDHKLLQQFLWEARITAYLDHPNIVPVHDLGFTADGDLFFTMKLVRGTTLEAELAKVRASEAADTQLTLHRRLRLFLHLCNAMAFAHARGVLHRDLKPANVMVGEYGEVLVTDWGIALPLPDASGDALREILPKDVSLSRSAGTPMYMSPEQARGEDLDARSDVYSLSVLLYELISLRPPFEANTLQEVLDKVQRADFAPLRAVCPIASTALEAVVAKGMALAPSERYATMRELAEDIEMVLEGRTPKAEAAPLVKQVARYYVGRDPALARMRIFDIELWMISCHFFGAGLFLVFTVLVPVPWTWFWLFLLAGLIVAARPTREWIRLRRERPEAR
jgi:serine/threonine-protein kinase